jgi:hypothetical protein
MDGARRPPDIMSDDWMHQQQLRAEVEADAWRRLRKEIAQLPAEPAPAPARDPHKSGSTILKALVRVGLGAFGAYLAFISAADNGLGEFEVWLAVMAGFAIALALSMFDPFRRLVHFLAETARWALILAICFGGLWVLLNPLA